MAERTRITKIGSQEKGDEYLTPYPLSEEMGLTAGDFERRKKVVEFTDADTARLARLSPYAREYAVPVIEQFYRHLMSFEEMRVFFQDPKTLDYVKRKQNDYFVKLTEGKYDMEYLENRLLIGAVHERVGLPIKTYLSMYAYYERLVSDQIKSIFQKDPVEAFDTFMSLLKLIHLDMIAAIETYTYRRERTIRQQEEAIRELSTPVLRIRDRLLILPIIGLIDAKRAMQITGQLLRAIRDTRSKVVVIDITGVPVVDTETANHLVQTVEAARLLGAEVITTGLSPEIAQTIVRLGVDLSRLNTVGDLQGGIEEAERILGYSTEVNDESQERRSRQEPDEGRQGAA